MHQINKEELLSLIETLRQIRQKTEETIALLECLVQLQQPHNDERQVDYDPDAYLSEWINETSVTPHLQCEEGVAGNFMNGGDRNA